MNNKKSQVSMVMWLDCNQICHHMLVKPSYPNTKYTFVGDSIIKIKL